MRKSFRLAAVVGVAFAATLVACGSSSSTSNASPTAVPSTAIPTAAPTATPTSALASLTCPSESTVNSDLALTVGAPISQPAADLPAGNSGIVCTYSDSATPQVVVIDVATGPATTSFISLVAQLLG